MRVLVLGAGGQVGRALVAALPAATALGHADLDIADAATAPIDWAAYDTIVNAAAFTDVDGAETAEGRAAAWRANAAGPAALAAIVDLRAGESFGRVETFELHPGNAIFVPRGCGNSYQTLTPDVVYSYLVNEHWSPEARYTLVQAFDPALGIDWPIGEDAAIRSEKDRGHPPLSAISPMEIK